MRINGHATSAQVGAEEPCHLYLQMCEAQATLARVHQARGEPELALEPEAAASRCIAAVAGLDNCKGFMRELLSQQEQGVHQASTHVA